MKYIDMFDPDNYDPNDAFVEPLGDYTYRVKTAFNNPIADGAFTADEALEVKVFLQIWDGVMKMDDAGEWSIPVSMWPEYNVSVTRTVLYDLDNKPMAAFDKQGNKVATNANDAKEPVMPEKPKDNDTSGGTEPPTPTPTPTPDPGPDTPQPGDPDNVPNYPPITKPSVPETSESTPNVPDEVIEGEAEVTPGKATVVETDAGDITVTTSEDDTALEGSTFVVETVTGTENDLANAIGANASAETKEIAEAAEKAVEDGNAIILDLSFIKDSDKVQPGKPVTVTLPLPTELKSTGKIFVYHVSEEGITLIASPEVKDGAITFTTDAFSPYIFSKVELKTSAENSETASTTPDSTGETAANPSTGIVNAFVPVLIAAGAAAIAAKKRK